MKTKTTNPYARQNAAFAVDGYLMPATNQTEQQAFDAAKAQVVQQLRIQIADVESLTLEQFQGCKKGGYGLPARVAIVVHNGVVAEVYASDRKALVEVLDLDTDELETREAAEEEIVKLKEEAGTMVLCD